MLNHVSGHPGRRQCFELLLHTQLCRIETGQALDLARQVDAAQGMAVGRADFNADHFRAEVGCFALTFLGVVTHFTQPTMQGQCVETVGRRLLASRLPVGVNDKALRWTEYFHALVGATEEHVVIPLGIAQEFVERWSIDIPGRKDQTAIQRDPSLFQAQFFFGQHLAVHAFTLDG